MFRRDEIPAWLAVDWWVLLVVSVVVQQLASWAEHTKLEMPLAEIASWFITVWQLLQTLWLRRQTGRNMAVLLLAAALGFELCAYLSQVSMIGAFPRLSHVLSISCFLGSIATFVWAAFVFRSNFEAYSAREGYGRILSGWMTLFFSVYYFQYQLHVFADDLASRLRLQRD